jgi:hypothetical protein
VGTVDQNNIARPAYKYDCLVFSTTFVLSESLNYLPLCYFVFYFVLLRG